MIPRRGEVLRIEAFSDAVFAFALTLLVVSLEVPKSFDQLIRTMQGFFAFACTFAAVFWIWFEHNLFFRRFGMQDGLTVTLTGALLFVVLFYVYPLKFLWSVVVGQVLGHSEQSMTDEQIPTLFTIYGLGFVVIFAVFALMYRHAYRKRAALGLDALEIFNARAETRRHLLTSAIGLVSVATALLMPPRLAATWSGPVYTLLGPVLTLNGWRDGRARTRLEASLKAKRSAAPAAPVSQPM